LALAHPGSKLSARALLSPVNSAGNGTIASSTTTVPVLSRTYTFQPRDAQLPPYKLPAMASSPLGRGTGQKFNGVDFGVDLNLLMKTSPRTMLKGFTGSAYVPPVGYILSAR
jgi:hypothetical protein